MVLGRFGLDFEKLSLKYRGPVAHNYEARRRGAKWRAELNAVQEFIRHLPSGSKILDVPIGTGRLIPVLASRSLSITGVDSSAEMLAEAEECALRAGIRARLVQGDIRTLPFSGESFRLVTCVRFLNWIAIEGVEEVVRELSRVSSDMLLVGIRYITAVTDVELSPRNLVRTSIRLAGVPSGRVRSMGMHIHRRRAIEALFEKLQLTVLEKRLIERRSDCTDYVFYLLQKR